MTESDSSDLHAQLVATVPNLRAFAISLCANVDNADDLVQETLLKAWKRLDSFEKGTNLKAWLFTILRNTYFSDRRKHRREIADVDGVHAASQAMPPEQPGHMDLADFNRALATLSDDQREALILVGAEGFSYEEVAEICGCAIGTVKSRVNRARIKLVDLLGLEGAQLKSIVEERETRSAGPRAARS